MVSVYCFHNHRNDRSDGNRVVVRWVRFITFWGDREVMYKFPGRRKYTKTVGKLEKFVEYWGVSGHRI